MKNKETDRGIVYSTEYGRMCPSCSKPAAECLCGQKSAVRAGDGIVRVGLETKGRRGKDVTIITGVPLDDAGLKDLGRRLKAKCGSGGTVKEGIIEIQGDHRDVLLEDLKKRGWTVKRAGG
jgi:translation initiation factor 1